ncbi:peptidoglycan-binding protein [Neobacillus sedimentimangrovi]|uniref:peptidoglycan-binding protein n=1 Tax=Neobacillus sedimentimangrovi TaxID=2699460 RepID=UPI0013D6E1F4|nr:peptidoglycan-binding protein [Neobacillus sedimentimangrovi]
MALFYDKRNRENLEKLADHTKAAAIKWYQYLVDNNINVLIYETIRTKETQQKYVREGASKTMRSYHIVGQALDFVPVDDKGNTHWDWYGKAEIQKAIAEAKWLGFEWGGDWKSFKDQPHLQYNYKGYGTDTFNQSPNMEVPKPAPVPAKNNVIATIQETLNSRYNAKIKTDGLYGPKTRQALLKGLQTELNKQFGARLVVDGVWGPKTKAACVSVRKGAKGNITWIVQAVLYCKGYDPKGIDGVFGSGTAAAVLAFQKAHNLAQDAIVGKNTFEKLFA